MSAFWLKMIAALTMLVDHTGMMLFPKIELFRIIGRLAFPIYAYLIAEGFRYTRDRRIYLLRIFLLGLVCQIVYTLATGTLYINVLLVFSLSLIVMLCADGVKRAIRGEENFAREMIKRIAKTQADKKSEIIISIATAAAVVLSVGWFCSAVEVDYGFWGVMLPVLAFIFDEKYPRLALFSLGLFILCVHFSSGGLIIQYYSLISIPLLLCYNGSRGKISMKYFFYIFYPAHLLILYLISTFIQR